MIPNLPFWGSACLLRFGALLLMALRTGGIVSIGAWCGRGDVDADVYFYTRLPSSLPRYLEKGFRKSMRCFVCVVAMTWRRSGRTSATRVGVSLGCLAPPFLISYISKNDGSCAILRHGGGACEALSRKSPGGSQCSPPRHRDHRAPGPHQHPRLGRCGCGLGKYPTITLPANP